MAGSEPSISTLVGECLTTVLPKSCNPGQKQILEYIQFEYNSSKIHLQSLTLPNFHYTMEQCTLRNVNNYLNINIYSFLQTSDGQSSYLYLKVVHFFNSSVNYTSVAA